MRKLSILLILGQVLTTSSSLTDKIVGGSEVHPSDLYPYTAFFVSYRNKCGATIINHKHALTAAHCIKFRRPKINKHFLIVGHLRVNSLQAFGPNPQLVFGADSIIPIKEFIREPQGKDVAILRLDRFLRFTPRVGPACLPSLPGRSYANMEAVATGWGNTVGYDPGQFVIRNSSTFLREVTLNVVPPHTELCTKAVSDQEAYLCAYSLGKDTCQGDSGGPLTIRRKGVFVLIGVVHGGAGCGAQNYAGTYARVSYFLDWIKDNVGRVCTEEDHAHWPHATTQMQDSQIVAAEPNNAGCRCSSFINRSGYGNCAKADEDYGGLVSCYVLMPSSCTDLSRSGTNPGKFLSAQACQGGPTAEPASIQLPTLISPITTSSTMSPVIVTSEISPISESSTMSPIIASSIMSPMVISGSALANSAGCSCSDFVNINGFGRCKKADSSFTGSTFGIMSCYVNLPSSCVDLRKSGTNPRKYLSTQACANRPEQVSPLPMQTNSGCQCTDFVNKNGFGRCRKPDSDFSGSVSCYVEVPSTCQDLAPSGTNPGKFLSAEACKFIKKTQSQTQGS